MRTPAVPAGRGGRRGLLLAAAVGALALLALACTEEPPGAGGTAPTPGNGGGGGGELVIEEFAGEVTSFGALPDEPVQAEGEPIKVGMINQENVPIGSFPEVRLGALAAADFINTELGGVGGRPIELIPCITNFSVEGSQRCAQDLVQQGVVAVVGGLDITSNGSIPILEQNEVPYVGGIPVNFEEMSSPISFQFSGGSPGAMTAFATNAMAKGAERVAVVYADFPPIKAAAVDFGVALLEAGGVPEIDQIAYPIGSTDMLPIITQAAAGDPDAILMFAADAACVRTMQTAADLGIEADIYLVGSCAAPAILAEAGDTAEGIIFNIEGPLDMEEDVVDGPLYLAAGEHYGTEGFDPQSAGTVSFRAVMNLWSIMQELGPEDVSSASIIEALRAAEEHPSWDGHAFTCDGNQIPALPALCAPQQVLARAQDGELRLESDGWIDVPAVLAEAGAGR